MNATATHDAPMPSRPDAAPAASSLTPRSAARTRAQVAASYVAAFVAGLCTAAIPLLMLLKQVAEHKDEILAVAALAERIGWPALVALVAGGLFAWDRRAARADRAEERALFRSEIAATRRDGRAEVESLSAKLDVTLRDTTAVLRALLHRLGPRPTASSAETTGPQERIRPGADRGRRATIETPIAEEVGGGG